MSLITAMFLFSVNESKAQTSSSEKTKSTTKFTHRLAGNPYLPLWEHLPDGEPRVFEDPDSPGKYRAYIIGSHDLRVNSYCGPDIRAWSAPVEDLTSWRERGIRAGYRGEVMVCLINLDPSHTIRLARGDLIAQLVVQPVTRCDFSAVTELPASERGTGGHGSTGGVAAWRPSSPDAVLSDGE